MYCVEIDNEEWEVLNLTTIMAAGIDNFVKPATIGSLRNVTTGEVKARFLDGLTFKVASE